MSRKIKTRGSSPATAQPYPINEFPSEVIHGLGKRIVYLMAMGRQDMSGDEFDRMYADVVDAQALSSPLGFVDIAGQDCAWSVKTVKQNSPHTVERVRLISGRNSPTFSAGTENPFADVQATGRTVLDIYNKRINDARQEHSSIRLLVLVRNMEEGEFALFERDISPLAVNNYRWEKNERNNFEGYEGEQHRFTWQPSGSQFTIIEEVPASACRFKILQQPATLDLERVLKLVHYKPEWVEIL